MADAILALNAGSSSIKFALYRIAATGALEPALRGAVEGIGTRPRFSARDATGSALGGKTRPPGPARDPPLLAAEEGKGAGRAASGHEAALGGVLDWLDGQLGGDVLAGVGHRIVHGGRDLTAPVELTDDAMHALEQLTPLAPLHQPHSLSPVRTVRALRPGLRQFGCFDTAFHRTMPDVAARFALPREYEEAGVRRYGFHGLSYEYIAGRLRDVAPRLAAGRVVVAHLGNGASLCAMRNGRSADTTMGFTALDGLVMGTRCGALDPGVVLYMLRQQGLSGAQIEDVLYRRSGLLGVSGLASDMQALLASRDARAREAIELFVFRIAQQTASMAASIGGLDGLVFTAGIGERAAAIRALVGERLDWLGVDIDPGANAAHAERIGTAQSRVDVRVIPTDEELMIARHTLDALRGKDSA